MYARGHAIGACGGLDFIPSWLDFIPSWREANRAAASGLRQVAGVKPHDLEVNVTTAADTSSADA